MSVYEVRRHPQSRRRSKSPATRSTGSPGTDSQGATGSSTERSTLTRPDAAAANASKRSKALESDGVYEPFGGTLFSGSFANRSRLSAELRLSHDPAHHTTA